MLEKLSALVGALWRAGVGHGPRRHTAAMGMGNTLDPGK